MGVEVITMAARPLPPEALTTATREELLASLNAYAERLPMNQLLSLAQSAGEAAGAFQGCMAGRHLRYPERHIAAEDCRSPRHLQGRGLRYPAQGDARYGKRYRCRD